MSYYDDLRRISRHARTWLGELHSRAIDEAPGPLSVLEAGRGPTLVFLHGVAVSKSCWRTVMHSLYGDFRTVALDVPGYNYSKDFPWQHYTLREMSDWLEASLQHIVGPGEKVHLVGHSVGAAIAAYHAAARPDSVASLCLVNLPSIFVDVHQDSDRSIQELNSLWVENADQFRVLLETFFHVPPNLPKVLVESYIKKLANKRGRFDRLVEDTCRSIPLLTPRMSTIGAPTLLMTGSNDKYCPPDTLEIIRRSIPHAETLVFSDSGHFSLIERPEVISSSLRHFVGSLRQ